MVDVFQGREWADPYNYGEVDPEGAWADLELDGWYFAEKDERGTYDGDPVGPFPTREAAVTEWYTRQSRMATESCPSDVRDALTAAHGRAGCGGRGDP